MEEVRRASTVEETGGVDLGSGVAGANVPPNAWLAFRRFMLERVVRNKWFDTVIMCFILANCVTLALDNPLDDPASTMVRVLAVVDLVRKFALAVASRVSPAASHEDRHCLSNRCF